MEGPFWSRQSKTSQTMHLFMSASDITVQDGKKRAMCGRLAKPVGRKQKAKPDGSVICISCSYNHYANERRLAKRRW